MKKTIENFNLENKKVIIRCDFNVPIKNGVITDDNRIKESLETINYAINHNAKVILMSHLGRVEFTEDKKDNSLYPVSVRLSELLNKKVIFIPETRGSKLEEAINNLKPQDVLLMENTRFEDIEGKKESKNDLELGKYWASLGEIYINDAFGTSHRSHASNVGIASNLPNGIGFLVKKELLEFDKVLNNPKRPFTVIMGGAKVADKIKVIENLASKADYLLIGGGMAYTFFKALGYSIGTSLLDETSIDFCKEMLVKYKDKIMLPVDTVVSKSMDVNSEYHTVLSNQIMDDEGGFDIGSKTVEMFSEVISKSNTIIWNGPVGMFEMDKYAKGTIGLCEALKKNNGIKIIGGGDSAAAVIKFGYKDVMTHISTGGGASLELLEGKTLPGIGIIDEEK